MPGQLRHLVQVECLRRQTLNLASQRTLCPTQRTQLVGEIFACTRQPL